MVIINVFISYYNKFFYSFSTAVHHLRAEDRGLICGVEVNNLARSKRNKTISFYTHTPRNFIVEFIVSLSC